MILDYKALLYFQDFLSHQQKEHFYGVKIFDK